MEAELLGTSDAYGVPFTMCSCDYCQQSEKRRRPCVTVKKDDVTLVFDAGPDIKEQLHESCVYDVDRFYVTHDHFDHINGLGELFHVTITRNLRNWNEYSDLEDHHGDEINVYGPKETHHSLKREKSYLLSQIDYTPIEKNETTECDGLEVTPVPVLHGRTETFGYVIIDTETDEKLVYAPDMAGWGRYADDVYKGADALVIEGAEVIGPELHGSKADVTTAIRNAEADEVFLVNVSEHLAQIHTDELIEAGKPHNVVSDFTQII